MLRDKAGVISTNAFRDHESMQVRFGDSLFIWFFVTGARSRAAFPHPQPAAYTSQQQKHRRAKNG
jgi:hypothetical protein